MFHRHLCLLALFPARQHNIVSEMLLIELQEIVQGLSIVFRMLVEIHDHVFSSLSLDWVMVTTLHPVPQVFAKHVIHFYNIFIGALSVCLMSQEIVVDECEEALAAVPNQIGTTDVSMGHSNAPHEN